MKESKPYPQQEEDSCVLSAQEPAVALAAEGTVIPRDTDYAHIINGVLQITPGIEEEIAAADQGQMVTMDQFKSMFAKWL